VDSQHAAPNCAMFFVLALWDSGLVFWTSSAFELISRLRAQVHVRAHVVMCFQRLIGQFGWSIDQSNNLLICGACVGVCVCVWCV